MSQSNSSADQRNAIWNQTLLKLDNPPKFVSSILELHVVMSFWESGAGARLGLRSQSGSQSRPSLDGYTALPIALAHRD